MMIVCVMMITCIIMNSMIRCCIITISVSSTLTTMNYTAIMMYSIANMVTPSPPTKSLGFEGIDSSRLLILRGGNSHVR